MDVTMEYMDLPSAWKELPSAMHAPAMQKLREMMRRAGTPAASITSLASKSRSSVSGMAQNSTVPNTMMQQAYRVLRLMVAIMRRRF